MTLFCLTIAALLLSGDMVLAVLFPPKTGTEQFISKGIAVIGISFMIIGFIR